MTLVLAIGLASVPWGDQSGLPPVIVLPVTASGVERHAAHELAKYMRAMSGRDVGIATEDGPPEPGRTAVFVGRTRLGAAVMPADLPPDGFIVRTVPQSRGTVLVVAGGSDTSTLYAAYHALDRLWGVGFMWDGEHVPHVADWSLPEVTIREEPRFRIRQNLQGCAFAYSTPYWGWEEWKAEIDWTVKHKFNAVMLPWPSLDYEVWRQFGVELAPPSEHESGRRELIRRVAAYARRLGVRCLLPAFAGGVPPQFVAQHPEARLIDVKWGESAAVPHLFPSDPWFRRIGEAIVREYAGVYGTDHVYNIDPYPETRPGATPQEQAEIKQAFADNVVAYLKAADPHATWYASGWAFLDEGFWPKEAVSAFLARIPADSFYVNDIWAEANPIYKRLNYFDRHDWGFSVLHSFGGDDHMRGDLRGLVRAVQDVAADPSADRCMAFYINPEFVHYNVLYFELAARLGWAPEKVDLDRFLNEYVDLRYGRDAPSSARQAVEALAGSVYGPAPGHEPAWQRRPAAAGLQPADLAVGDSLPKGLRQAAELLLRDRARLLGNPLYERDCVDVTRQYASEVFNRLHARAVAAYAAGNQNSLLWCTQQAERAMALVEGLLATRPEYRVESILQAALNAPGASAALERAIKDDMLTFAGSLSWLIDYQSKDMQELLAGYYGPRVRAFYQELRSRAERGERALPSAEEMLPTYRRIETAWLDTPLRQWARSSGERAADAAARVLAEVSAIADQMPQRTAVEARRGDIVGWEDDFTDVGKWKETYAGGHFAAEHGVASLTSDTKWCLVGTDLDLPLAKYPILSFRYRSTEPAKRGVWVWVTWTDSEGRTSRNLVWNQGLSEEWAEVNLDLEALLSFVGRPVRITRIELNNQEPPQVSEWDWMTLSSRAEAQP